MFRDWKSTAISHVVLWVLSFLALCCAGLFSAPDLVVMSLAACSIVSALGAIGSVVCCYTKLRCDFRTHLNRPPLSNEEFAALLPGDVKVDLDVVQEVRQIAAECFWSLPAECFYPGDRLNEDLHLPDVAFSALDGFWIDMEEHFGAAEEDMGQEEIRTFGDVVLAANRRRRKRNGTA
jgi:hypothetical protein